MRFDAHLNPCNFWPSPELAGEDGGAGHRLVSRLDLELGRWTAPPSSPASSGESSKLQRKKCEWKATIQVPFERWSDVHHSYATQFHSRSLLREKSEMELWWCSTELVWFQKLRTQQWCLYAEDFRKHKIKANRAIYKLFRSKMQLNKTFKLR